MDEKKRKVTVVGAGAVGSTFAYALAQSGYADEIAITDMNKNFAEGQALDLVQGLPFWITNAGIIPKPKRRVQPDRFFKEVKKTFRKICVPFIKKLKTDVYKIRAFRYRLCSSIARFLCRVIRSAP